MPQQQIATTQVGKSVIINESSDGDDNEEGTEDANTKEESIVTRSLGESASASKQNEATRYVSHITMPFEHLQKDMYALSQKTNGMGNVFWNLSVDLATRVAKIEFCGNTQQKDVTMTSTGKGKLTEAN